MSRPMTPSELTAFTRKHLKTIDAICDILTAHKVSNEDGEQICLYIVSLSQLITESDNQHGAPTCDSTIN